MKACIIVAKARLLGFYPNIEYFKINKENSKYYKWDVVDIYKYNEGMDYSDVKFLRSNKKTYMIVYDKNKYKILNFSDKRLSNISEINISYPSYEIETSCKDNAAIYIKNKYISRLPFFDKNNPEERILTDSDTLYSKIESEYRQKFIQKPYLLVDLDNDGEDEMFFKWEIHSRTRMNSTLYLNGYGIFKKENNEYKLIDTNLEASKTAKYDILNNVSYFNNNIFFEKYNGKIYTLILDHDYSEKNAFEDMNTDIVTIYYNEKEIFNEIGTINIVNKPKIKITKNDK